jgi:hypothetical protein
MLGLAKPIRNLLLHGIFSDYVLAAFLYSQLLGEWEFAEYIGHQIHILSTSPVGFIVSFQIAFKY